MSHLRLISRNGRSENWGCDVGPFPRHAFRYAPPAEGPAPLRAVLAGTDEWVAGCFRQRLRSDVCALECVTAGSLVCTQDGVVHDCGPGDVFLVRHHRDHQMVTGSAGHCRKHTLVVDGPLLEPLLDTLGLAGHHVLRPAAFDRLCTLIEDVAARIERADCGAAVYEALRLAARDIHRRDWPACLERAIAACRARPGAPIPLDELAAAAEVSPATLNRAFRRHLGTTAVAWQNRRRLDRAAELLRLGGDPVGEVARRCGWRDPLRFSTVFRQAYGCSPSAWRRGG